MIHGTILGIAAAHALSSLLRLPLMSLKRGTVVVCILTGYVARICTFSAFSLSLALLLLRELLLAFLLLLLQKVGPSILIQIEV